MVELYKIRFLIFVSLMIFPAHALDVILSTAHGAFKQKSEIKTKIINGQKLYDGTLNRLTYQAQPGTFKVIVYIIDRSRFVEIIRNAFRQDRWWTAWELSEWNCELVILGIENFDDDEYHLISEFIVDKIQRQPSQPIFTIETIGENNFDQFYQGNGVIFAKYQGNLLAHLRSIPHGALKPVRSNNKMIKSYDHKGFVREQLWPVTMVHDEYVPDVDVNDAKYNFKLKYPYMDVYLVILEGNEYSAATRHGTRSPSFLGVKRIVKEMFQVHKELVYIVGAFNFEWTEIDILTQIILKHSEVPPGSHYNVYTFGVGMFNTIYLNMNNDGRFLMQKPNANVAEIMKLLLGEEAKQRSIDVYYSDNGLRQHLEVPITLANGRYLREHRFDNFSFPWTNQRIAFIVYDSTEMNDQINPSRVRRLMEKLESSGINVVVIKTTNFGWYDAHIIAEWIDLHRGNVNSEQIAVLGGGIFDTIFQSSSTTYNTLLNTETRALKSIRNAYVKNTNEKRVFAAKIDISPNFEVWSYPMNTVNGFYEPDLIPDTNMFNTLNETKILFIITSAHNFHQVAEVEYVVPVASKFRNDFGVDYPFPEWSVFLVGLDNFEERDYHLFAELVMMQTRYGRSAQEFVRTYNYDISQALFQYKDNAPFGSEKRSRPVALIKCFFRSTLMIDIA